MALYGWQQPLADKLFDILRTGGVAVNALPPGTGKTFLTLDVIMKRGRPALVIAPKQASTQWDRAAVSYGVRSSIIGIVNPERISLGITEFYNGTTWALPDSCDVHWDEVHKGPSGIYSLATLALARLKRADRGVQLISATLADSPLKLRAAGYLLGLHGFLENDFKRWAINHECFMKPAPNGSRKLAFTSQPAKAQEALRRIRADIGDRMISMRIEEVPGFPECVIEAKLYDLETEDQDAINAAYDEMGDRLKAPGSTALVELQRARERAEYFKCGALVDSVMEDTANGYSCVVFFNHRSGLFRFRDLLEGRSGRPMAAIYGGQTQRDRDKAQDAFQANEVHVCGCTSDAGGVSLNLHDVLGQRPRRSYITPGWSASTALQVLGRIRRSGGTPVVQTFVLAAGTPEEYVYERLQMKLGNVDALNDADFGVERST